MYSPSPASVPDNQDSLSDYVVKVTNDSELLEITYRNQDNKRGSLTATNRKRLSDYLKSGLENGGKVFVAMAHETIV